MTDDIGLAHVPYLLGCIVKIATAVFVGMYYLTLENDFHPLFVDIEYIRNTSDGAATLLR